MIIFVSCWRKQFLISCWNGIFSILNLKLFLPHHHQKSIVSWLNDKFTLLSLQKTQGARGERGVCCGLHGNEIRRGRNHVSKSKDCLEQLTIDTANTISRNKTWNKNQFVFQRRNERNKSYFWRMNDWNERILSLQDTEFNFLKSTRKNHL